LPNGPQPESPQARELLHRVARRPEVTLAYVTGRNRQLLQEAIETYDLPIPNYAVGDVGATIFQVNIGQHNNLWEPWEAWARQIAPDWNGWGHERIATLFADIAELELQEAEKQNRFKLSYYTPETINQQELKNRMQVRLRAEQIRASLIWSVDAEKHHGLLDVLPERATKFHAIRFIMQHDDYSERNTVFAGDSGNDMPALTSGLQAILVRNASDEVRKEALRDMQAKGLTDLLYLAEGNFLGMNGNYAAGVLEGLVHYIPEAGDWMKPGS